MWCKVVQQQDRGLGTYVLDVLTESLLFSSTFMLIVSLWTTKVGKCSELLQLTRLSLSFLSSRDEERILQSLGNKMKLQFLPTLLYIVFYMCRCFSVVNVYAFLSSLFWYFSGLYLIVEVLQFANLTLYLLYVLQKINCSIESRVNYRHVFCSRVLPVHSEGQKFLSWPSRGYDDLDVLRSRYSTVKEMSETLMSIAEASVGMFLTVDFVSAMLLLYSMTQVGAQSRIPSTFVVSLVCCICLLSSICLPCHFVAQESRKTATLLSGLSLAFPPTSRSGVQVSSLLLHVSHNPVTFSLLGTINLNFELILSFIGTIITYLLVLVTFQPEVNLYLQLNEK